MNQISWNAVLMAGWREWMEVTTQGGGTKMVTLSDIGKGKMRVDVNPSQKNRGIRNQEYCAGMAQVNRIFWQ